MSTYLTAYTKMKWIIDLTHNPQTRRKYCTAYISQEYLSEWGNNDIFLNGRKMWTETSQKKTSEWAISKWTINTPKRVTKIKKGNSMDRGAMIQMLWKIDGQFLKILNLCLPYNLGIPLLGIYSRDLKTYVHSKTWRRMFIAALFGIAKS